MEINTKQILKDMFVNYFLEKRDSNLTDSEKILKGLAVILSDDAIYGSIKNGEKYLISRINEYTSKLYLGQVIVCDLHKLIEFEQKLIIQNDLKHKQYNLYLHKLSKLNPNEDKVLNLDDKERRLVNKSLKDCDYFLSEIEEVEFHDKKYKVKDLNDFQKLAIIFEATDESSKHFQRRCEFYSNKLKSEIIKNVLEIEKNKTKNKNLNNQK